MLVVDNGSDDGSVAYLRGEGCRTSRCRATSASPPRSTSASLGPRRDAVLVLNADTVLEPGCVGRAARRAGRRSAAGRRAAAHPAARGRRRVPPTPAAARLYSAGQALTADGRALRAGAGEPQGPSCWRRREIFGVCGAACLLRRELFERPRRLRRDATSPSTRTSTSTCGRGSPAGASRTFPRQSSGTSATPPGARASPPGGGERAARRPQPARDPDQVHAGSRDPADRRGRGGRADPRRPPAPPPRHLARQAGALRAAGLARRAPSLAGRRPAARHRRWLGGRGRRG